MLPSKRQSPVDFFSIKRNNHGNPLENERGKQMSKKDKKISLSDITAEEKMKYEIAEELGLLDKVLAEGWKSLSSKETGRIGGLVTKRRREEAGNI